VVFRTFPSSFPARVYRTCVRYTGRPPGPKALAVNDLRDAPGIPSGSPPALSAMADINVSSKVSPDVRDRLDNEAAANGRNRSAQIRHILEQHFAGEGVDQLRGHLAELTDQVSALRAEGGAASDSGAAAELTELRAELARMREQVEELGTAMHFALRVLVFQKEELRPTEEDFAALDEHFQTIARNFRGYS